MKTCPFCKAGIRRKRIEHVHRWGGHLYLFKKVPAEVCTQCGETFLGPDALRQMDEFTAKGKVGRIRISVPVISLPDKVGA